MVTTAELQDFKAKSGETSMANGGSSGRAWCEAFAGGGGGEAMDAAM